MENQSDSPIVIKTSGKQHVKDGIIDFTGGSLGGVALVYVGQPLDTVKVKMQTFPTLYKNMFNCFATTLKTDGVRRGLYAGTVPALATNVAENAVLFFAYGFCQKFMQHITGAQSIDELSTVTNATAGFLAAFFSSVAICPTELVKCRLQAMHEVNKQQAQLGKAVKSVGPLQLTAEVIRTEGVKGMFRGLVPTIVREMPGYFFFFGAYEGTRELLRKPDQKKEDIGLVKTMIAGGMGGGIFWTALFPADVAKSRIQVNNLNENMMKLIFKIARHEGIGALYNGLLPTVIRAVPATAVMFLTIEYSKKWMHHISRDL
uniref:Mitochondrial ornithine transporter 1-like n=1 Tax=Diabrotica virgifera virgifera TaxID=50390 RepID=A0A6P7GVJ1_DIAVI